MTTDITHTEARLALDTIDQRRRDVIAEINVPRYYWPTLAIAWAGLGFLADYGPAWASVVVTALFGATHAAIGPKVLSGRRGSSHLSIRHDAVSRHIPVVIIGFLVAMTAVTVGIALVFNADGARHPAALAGVVIAALVAASGPGLMALIRARAQRQASR